MPLTIRILKNTNFPLLYRRLLEEDDLSLEDIKKLLSSATIFINSSNATIRKLGYRIIVMYANRYEDYVPLYEVSINGGLYPVVKLIERKLNNSATERSYIEEINSSYIEMYRKGEMYQSKEQASMNKYYTENVDSSISIIAPTSYGKTDLIISTIKANPKKKICVITPTKALLMQTAQRIIRSINIDTKIILHPEMYNGEDNLIAVLTQERLLRLLRDNEKLYFDYVIIDEAHNLLNDDQREYNLATSIIVLNRRNINTAFKYLTPFINDPTSLKIKHTSHSINNYTIEETVKTEKVYYYDTQYGNGLEMYDPFINEWVKINKVNTKMDGIDFIKEKAGEKNIIYFNKPTDIEEYAKKLINKLPDIEITGEIEEAIKSIKDYTHDEYLLIKCLRKGIIYHHGSVPDVIRSYLEYLFTNNKQIKFIITSSTLLEGVNIPATKLFVMDNKKGNKNLDASSFKNLIGRICRFSEIFDKNNGSLKLLEPEIYLLNDGYYAKNSNIEEYIKSILNQDKQYVDEKKNVLLESNERADIYSLKKAEEFVENYENGSIQNYIGKRVKTEIGKVCYRNNITEINIFDHENEMQETLNKYKMRGDLLSSTDDILEAIREIFIKHISNDDKLKRLNEDKALKYYKMLLLWQTESYPFNKMIAKIISYWQKIIKNGDDTIIYVGRWGDITRNGYRKYWTDISTKNQEDLINLAIVKIKDENDFIENNIIKYIEALNDFGLVDKNTYKLVKYGTDNDDEISLIENGLSLSLSKKIIEKYKQYLSSSATNISWDSRLIDAMKENRENLLLIHEATINCRNN